MSGSRQELSAVRRVVIKIGSRALAEDPGLPAALAKQIATLEHEQRGVVLVSSGAIALGIQRLGYPKRPKEMARLQAAAAAGQFELMRRYEQALDSCGVTAAQVLLTHADLSDRGRLNNARAALLALLDAGALPIVNENDTVSTEEIAFGDNDQLAAMVVPLVEAELLLLLTDVDGVLDRQGERIATLSDDDAIDPLPGPKNSTGSGGISSKVSAARKAARSGAHVVIARATLPGVVQRVISGEDVGTLIPPRGQALRARQHWIAYTLRPRGTVLVDAGAARAVSAGKSSLLPVGVLGVRGSFNAGDAVRISGPDGTEVARGLSRLGALDIARAAGKRRAELELAFGAGGADLVVVHRDDLVMST